MSFSDSSSKKMINTTSSFEKKFFDFSKNHRLFDTDSILVAFSGGSDSAVLLTLLNQYAQATGIRIAALHVNHMIRSEEAERDERFCASFCKERMIPFFSVKVNIPLLSQQTKKGLEETARNERYRILTEYAEENEFAYIATAHNATDNMETVLFHLIRGTSVHGVGGIHPKRGNLTRPLLPFSKEEIEEYAKAKSIPFVIDSTNYDTAYTRNAIRHTVLPHLRTINPAAEEAFLRFTEIARTDDKALYALAENYRYCENIQVLASLDNAILSRVLLIKLHKTAHNEITEKHVSKVIELIRKANDGLFQGRYSLPGKIAVSMHGNSFTVIQDHRKKKNSPPRASSVTRLSLEEKTLFENKYQIFVTSSSSLLHSPDKVFWQGVINAQNIKGNLSARTRSEGDCYRAGNMTRKIKKLLCDCKIDLELRKNYPILCDEDGIVAIPHLPVADRVNPKNNEKAPKLYIEITDIATENTT